jgi:N-acetylglucosaminyldiphosphoundecaprenol N-acetyl-beta-D-mannosaminyltransferase
MKRHHFLGYPVDQVSVRDVLLWIKDANGSREAKVIAVLNINKLWLASRDPCIVSYLHSAALVIPEYAIVWGAKRLGISQLEPVYGFVLTKEFIPFAVQHHQRPFFLGAKPGVVEALKFKLERDYPELEIAGMHHGYLGDVSVEAEAIRKIQAANADILLVAMGSPLQEYWIDAHKEILNVPVVIGVGGTFDVLAGIKSDTPDWLRGSGWEWLYRLLLQPKHYWKRYLVTNPWFMWMLFREKIGRRGGK